MKTTNNKPCACDGHVLTLNPPNIIPRQKHQKCKSRAPRQDESSSVSEGVIACATENGQQRSGHKIKYMRAVTAADPRGQTWLLVCATQYLPLLHQLQLTHCIHDSIVVSALPIPSSFIHLQFFPIGSNQKIAGRYLTCQK